MQYDLLKKEPKITKNNDADDAMTGQQTSSLPLLAWCIKREGFLQKATKITKNKNTDDAVVA